MIVGALRPPFCPRTPVAKASAFDQPFLGSWQLAQLMVLSFDSRVSKYSCLPSSTFSAVCLLDSGQASFFSPSGKSSSAQARDGKVQQVTAKSAAEIR